MNLAQLPRTILAFIFLTAPLHLHGQSPRWTVGMSQCNLGEPWRVQMNADIKRAAEAHPELKVVFKDAQNDNLRQASHIDEFTRARVNLIIISPKEAAPLTAPVAEAFRKGIPVIVLDRRVLGDQYTCFIGADNRKIGRAAGRWIAKLLSGKGNVVELKGLMTSTPGQDRNAGFREGIKGSGVNVVFEADMKWLEPNARKEMESALARFPSLDLVYAHNDPAAHGAYLAAKAAGREKKIVFVGIDGLPQEGQMYVKQGILSASFEYPTGGREAIENALAILNGKTVPREITLPSRVYTKSNIDAGGEWLSDSGPPSLPRDPEKEGEAEMIINGRYRFTMRNAASGFALLAMICCMAVLGIAQEKFNGLTSGMGNLSRLSKAKTRSISPENFTGEKGKAGMATNGTGAKAARDLGQGWKISPSIKISAGQSVTLAEIKEPGAIQHIWMTPTGHWRYQILRMYWDDEEAPSVEAPVGDFFACGWGSYSQVSSLPVCVNPGSAFNCYWEMPFRKSCRITMENTGEDDITLYYQIDYTVTEIPANAAYFHAQFRRVNPLPYKDVYTILDGVKGWGHYVGTYMAWGVNNNGWWGEGEIKFYMDGDKDYPTICGTGTEDYFCGSYDFENRVTRQYQEFTTPYSGLAQVIRPDGLYGSQQRFGLYRWHIMDPIRFEKDLRVTIQALGWHSGGRYLPLQDDIASVAFWYQAEPHAVFPKLPGRDYLEIQ